MAYPTITKDGCAVRPPVVDEIDCAPTTTDGEITEIIFGSSPFTDTEIADAVEMATRLDNTPDAALDMVRLKVTGKLNAPEGTETIVEGGVKVQSKTKSYSVEAEFYNDSDTNYNAARYLEYAKSPSIIYFVMDGKIYGGDANVEDGISSVLNIIPSSEGRGSKLKYTVNFSWDARTLPARADFVLA